MFKFKSAKCQSCGMPLKKDSGGGGTNADGSKTDEYCSRCYQQGQFTEPNLTMEQMKEKVKGKLMEMGFPQFAAGLMTRSVSQLKRWSK